MREKRNMTVLPIIIGSLGTFLKILKKPLKWIPKKVLKVFQR